MKTRKITKITLLISLLFLSSFTALAQNAQNTQKGKKAQVTQNAQNAQNTQNSQKETQGEVILMNKQMFIEQIFDYTRHTEQWEYKGSKPAIIDLYADWCGPCRMIAPILKELAQEYAGQIQIYKVNVDKDKELAALFQATSIPLLVFIPLDESPQLFRGAADKATYKKAIDEFLLKQK